ncbi:MAG: head-tail adaptor protein [Bacillus sp. (in: firmicutes)]
MKPRHTETFNDGYLKYGHKKSARSQTGKRTGEILTIEGKLAFQLSSMRESDFAVAGMLGAKLDMKVKTLYPPSFRTIKKNKLKAVIDGIEYDVINVDPDNKNGHLYFYLQEVGGYDE